MTKRIFDIFVSAFLLCALAPLMVLVAIFVRYKLGTPILFRQQRPGLGGRPFFLYKFRSMPGDKDKFGNLLPDSERVTRFGRILRASSLDELPELYNVLKGDMSLVGPRPLLMQYLDRYTPAQFRRHAVKPGITGWAQVNGRNAISWQEKFKLDVWYVDHHGMGLDLKILLMTAVQVFKRQGIHQKGHVTAEEFMGDMDHG